jgi:DNA polymerase-3 subunit beta
VAPLEFQLGRKELLQELLLAASIVETKTTTPILTNLLLKAENGTITITATNLDETIETSCPAQVAKPGIVTAPARKLLSYIRLLEGELVGLRGKENNWIQIRAGRSNTKMVGMSAASFPKQIPFPATIVAKLPVPELQQLIARVMMAVSSDSSRYTLNGAQLELAANEMTLVATDGHRLSLANTKVPLVGFVPNADGSAKKFLVAKKGLEALRDLLAATSEPEVEFAEKDNLLFFRCGPLRVYSVRKLTGSFPNYAAVLPQANNKIVRVGVKDFTETVLRVAQFADEKQNSIQLHLDKNQLKVSGASSELGESVEILDVTYAAEPVTVGLNADYLLDALKVIGKSEVRLEVKDSISAIQLRPDGEDISTSLKYVCMPMRR